MLFALRISIEYRGLTLDVGSDPRTLHLAVYHKPNKYDGSKSAPTGKDKVALVRRVVVTPLGHFFAFSPSARGFATRSKWRKSELQ
jgi:hypothetical protein